MSLGVTYMSTELVKVYESRSGPKTTVLWVSRHPPLKSQITELEKKLDSIEVYQLSGVIPSAEYVVEVVRKVNAKIVVPVLPLSMIARLAELSRNYGFTVVLAKMESIATTKNLEEAKKLVAEKPEARTTATYADGVIRVFEFKGFEKLVRVELVTEPL